MNFEHLGLWRMATLILSHSNSIPGKHRRSQNPSLLGIDMGFPYPRDTKIRIQRKTFRFSSSVQTYARTWGARTVSSVSHIGRVKYFAKELKRFPKKLQQQRTPCPLITNLVSNSPKRAFLALGERLSSSCFTICQLGGETKLPSSTKKLPPGAGLTHHGTIKRPDEIRGARWSGQEMANAGIHPKRRQGAQFHTRNEL